MNEPIPRPKGARTLRVQALAQSSEPARATVSPPPAMIPSVSLPNRSRFVWVPVLLVIPVLVWVCILAFRRSEDPLERSAADFQKNVRPTAPSIPAPPIPNPGDPFRPPAAAKYEKLNYSTGNVSMDLYRKEGLAAPEKPRKKDDFLNPPVNRSGSTDLDDRAKGPGGPE